LCKSLSSPEASTTYKPRVASDGGEDQQEVNRHVRDHALLRDVLRLRLRHHGCSTGAKLLLEPISQTFLIRFEALAPPQFDLVTVPVVRNHWIGIYVLGVAQSFLSCTINRCETHLCGEQASIELILPLVGEASEEGIGSLTRFKSWCAKEDNPMRNLVCVLL